MNTDFPINVHTITPGPTFFDELARQLLQCAKAFAPPRDISHCVVLVPALPMAVELRTALRVVSEAPLLLPHFDSLRHWVATRALPAISLPMPESERLVLLYEALRQREWFDRAALWGIAKEIASLLDELTAATIELPNDEVTLIAQLERAYAIGRSNIVAFEGHVIHELWHTLASMAPDAAASYGLRLAEIARRAEFDQPLCVLLDAPPEEALQPAERAFLKSYAETRPLIVFAPTMREARPTPLAATLDTAWLASPVQPLHERAAELARTFSASPLAGRLRLIPATSREQEAHAALRQIEQWLIDGQQRIAIIAQDRLSVRRLRALLERQRILVADETGWLLSTSRAAATIDALLEVVASDAYHRDVIDLLKSPFVAADMTGVEQSEAVFTIERHIGEASVRSGLPRIRHSLVAANVSADAPAFTLLDRLSAATALLGAKPAPLAHWLARLMRALETLGAREPLESDVAGAVFTELVESRQRELASNQAKFSFAAWRDWLNREFETTSFRDSRVASPIVITALNAVCLRRFDAAIVVGGDARQLAPARSETFFNQAVRRELGLRTREDGERELRRDLELLLATVPRVTVIWQAVQNGEANQLAPEISLLSSLNQLAWCDDLTQVPAHPRRPSAPDPVTAPGPTIQAQPAAHRALLPGRLSVSAYASLVGCPYRFFARHVLRLGEMDEVSEEMEKRDYGELVHRVLERFHTQHPLISDMAPAEALEALQQCVEAVFRPRIAENFLALGWRLRWEKRLAAYLDWQRAREREGWRWHQAEVAVSRQFALTNGQSIELHGRIDRVDCSADRNSDKPAVALYDYKAQAAQPIRTRLADDVQLPAYALMYGHAEQAAYVALDDDKIVSITAGDAEALAENAQAQGQRLVAIMEALDGGAPLPAHGVDRLCRHCEMRGLCRTDYVEEKEEADDERPARASEGT